MTHELVTMPDDALAFLQIERAPAQVLAEARQAAVAIKDVIEKKAKPVLLNGEQYLEFEDWQTVARFYGITAETEWTRYCEFGGARGFEARAIAKHAASGRIVSAGESMCLNDEPRWSSRPKYEWRASARIQIGEEAVPLAQLRSMAQTRAGAKALRNCLAWVVVLAGYRATPAEELETERGDQAHRVDTKAEPAARSADVSRPAGPQRKAADPNAETARSTINDIKAGKRGSNAKGPWVQWIIETTDGQKYSTFDDAIEKVARHAFSLEAPVEIVFTTNQYGRAIQSLSEAAEREPGSDDV